VLTPKIGVVSYWNNVYFSRALLKLGLAVSEMPLEAPPPRATRFGSPLVLSRVHWVKPELVAEVKYRTWTGDNLLRQVVYEGLREDRPAAAVRRGMPHTKPGTQSRTVTTKKPVARRRGVLSKP
jgi:hypothetical protein